MFSTIIAIIGIMVFTILIIFLICLMLQEKIEKSIYKIPFITKKVECYKINKRIKDVFNSAVLAAIFSIVMTMIVCVLCRSILEWMNTPSDIIDGAYSYIFVILFDMGMKYYKRYKIDGDKISWD